MTTSATYRFHRDSFGSMRRLVHPSFRLFVVGLTIAASDANDSGNSNSGDPPRNLECDLYMAQSTIPNAGLGIFTAIERRKGDTVGEGDVCIPLIDLEWHHPEAFYPFQEYAWAGEVM